MDGVRYCLWRAENTLGVGAECSHWGFDTDFLECCVTSRHETCRLILVTRKQKLKRKVRQFTGSYKSAWDDVGFRL